MRALIPYALLALGALHAWAGVGTSNPPAANQPVTASVTSMPPVTASVSNLPANPATETGHLANIDTATGRIPLSPSTETGHLATLDTNLAAVQGASGATAPTGLVQQGSIQQNTPSALTAGTDGKLYAPVVDKLHRTIVSPYCPGADRIDIAPVCATATTTQTITAAGASGIKYELGEITFGNNGTTSSTVTVYWDNASTVAWGPFVVPGASSPQTHTFSIPKMQPSAANPLTFTINPSLPSNGSANGGICVGITGCKQQ